MQEVKSKNIPRFGFGTIIWKIAIDCGLHNERAFVLSFLTRFCLSFLYFFLYFIFFFVAHKKKSEANNAIMGSDIAHHEESFREFLFFYILYIFLRIEWLWYVKRVKKKSKKVLEGPLLHLFGVFGFAWLLLFQLTHIFVKFCGSVVRALEELPAMNKRDGMKHFSLNWTTNEAKFMWKI